MSTITERQREIPVVREVDVVVAGAGVSGVFAALGAAKEGASVLLVDRFGDLGGNMGGAGLIMAGGTMAGGEEDLAEGKFIRFLSDLPREFSRRVSALVGEGEERAYPVVAHVQSRVAFEMASELGVELMLSAYASDPVMEGNEVRGLFVETKSGRVAVAAKVVIDATGDASVAARAGAPVRHRQPVEEMDYPTVKEEYRRPEYKYWNDGGLMYIIIGVNWEKYDAWRWPTKEKDWGPGDRRFFDANFEEEWNQGQKALVPALRTCEEQGTFTMTRDIHPRFQTRYPLHWVEVSPGVRTGVVEVRGEWDTGDWKDVSLAEEHARTHAFDGTRFMRENAPGFENVEVVSMAAFLGARGGPHILGEHLLTAKEGFESARHPDMLFLSHVEVHRGAPEPGYDVPYGMMLPKEIDGLLVTARGASFIRRGHDPSFRGRRQMTCFGQAAGIAAALACKDNVAPRDLDIKKLQRHLLVEGFNLGDEKRLTELGLT